MRFSLVQDKTVRCELLFALCALVFFFAWHAKTAVYSGGGPVKATPSTAAKLWLNGQKMGVPSVETSAPPLFATAFLCLWILFERRERVNPSAYFTPPPTRLSLCDRHLFLRPPPVHA